MRLPPVFSPSGMEPRLNALHGIRAVIFDVYGTLLLGGGPVHPDPEVDEELAVFLHEHGIHSEGSITTALAHAVQRSHAASTSPFPEVDLHSLWSDILHREIGQELFISLEDIRQPVALMPGATDLLQALPPRPLGLISNAQANTLPLLERLTSLTQPFAEELCVLSYRHGQAKPSALLFECLTGALGGRGILPSEAVIVGNDPRHDIAPAKLHGFRTILVMADRDSLRPGDTTAADAVVTDLMQIAELI
ncbi:MAG: HAD family hydrolase [Luteolibacter sp.]